MPKAATSPRQGSALAKDSFFFSPGLARKLGLNKAVVLATIHELLERTRKDFDRKTKDAQATHKNFQDGHLWVFHKLAAWHQSFFPWWSEKTVERTLDELRQDGLLVTGRYNTRRGDRTLWYRIDYDELDKYRADLEPVKAPLKGKALANFIKPRAEKGNSTTPDELHEQLEANPPHELPEPQHERTDAPRIPLVSIESDALVSMSVEQYVEELIESDTEITLTALLTRMDEVIPRGGTVEDALNELGAFVPRDEHPRILAVWRERRG